MSYMIKEVKKELRQRGFYIDTMREMDKIENQLIVSICICEVLNYGDHRYTDSFLNETLEYYHIDNFKFHRLCDENDEEYVYLVFNEYDNGNYRADLKNVQTLCKKRANTKFLKQYFDRVIWKFRKTKVA